MAKPNAAATRAAGTAVRRILPLRRSRGGVMLAADSAAVGFIGNSFRWPGPACRPAQRLAGWRTRSGRARLEISASGRGKGPVPSYTAADVRSLMLAPGLEVDEEGGLRHEAARRAATSRV